MNRCCVSKYHKFFLVGDEITSLKEDKLRLSEEPEPAKLRLLEGPEPAMDEAYFGRLWGFQEMGASQ